MLILNGKEVASQVRTALIPRVEKFRESAGRAPHLSVVIVGDDISSQIYVKNKKIACESVGMTSTIHQLPADSSHSELSLMIRSLNADDKVDGILVQFPLPSSLSSDEVLSLISPDKDADGLTYNSLGHFYAGSPVVSPCTPQGVMTILKHYQIPLEGINAVVVGRSNIVGRPMAQMLAEANATVTICHSKTKNLREHTSRADLVVVAAGKCELLGKDDFKKDSVIVDVGIHRKPATGKLCGDVRFAELEGWVHAATPVPGGVGPMTIATLIENTCQLAEKRAEMK